MRRSRIVSAVVVLGMGLAVACGSKDDTTIFGGDAGAAGESASGGASGGEGGDSGSEAGGGGSDSGGSDSGGAGGEGGAAGDSGNAGVAGQSGGDQGGAAGQSGAAGAAGQSGGAGEAGGGGGPTCKAFGDLCLDGTDCCSDLCDPNSNTCTSVVTMCAPDGADCESPTDCCSLSCLNGECSETTCISDNQACGDDEECCGGSCVGESCVPLNPGCRTSGNECTDDFQCCSKTCEDGYCKLGVSYCIQPGDVCSRDQDCCTGTCNIADGRTIGTCDDPPPGPAFCSGVDGVRCSACNECCSRLCAPFGPTGALICQPANGCHVTGDLCRKDSDCCGGTLDEELPGYGNVTCEIEPGKPVGICRNPNNGPGPGGACNPQGNVCHFKDYVCSISSARANCCTGLGAQSGVCQLDALGVPRCYGLAECRDPGETCSNSNDCCNGLPCVPDEQGVLRCYQPPPGGDPCVPVSGGCTVNADCCPGGTCIRLPGSITGTCGGSDPPGAGGAAGAGGEGGAAGAAGAAGEGGAGGAGGMGGQPPTCHEYGQLCDDNADCCNAVPCDGGRCRFPPG